MSTDFYDDFAGSADDVVEPAPEEPRIQWFHRRNFCDVTGKAKGLTVGWHSEHGQSEEWDTACAIAGLRTIHLKQEEGIVAYWQLGSNAENEDEWGSASPFILAKGCPTEGQMMASKSNRFGIAYGWGKGRNGLPRKVVKFRAFLPEIFEKPVYFVVGGKGMVGFLLEALGKDGHYRVLRANNQRLQEKGSETRTRYWRFRLNLMPGDDVSVKGTKGSSDVTKIITDIPQVITSEFLQSHHIGQWSDLVHADIKENDHSIEWSLKTSQEIEAGTDESSKTTNGHTSNGDESPYGLSDHPFDVGPDGEYAAEPVEFREPQEKPAAKPQPSNNLKPMTDAELRQIPGTANEAQRRALQRLGQLGTAQRPNLTKEEAGKAIASVQKR